MTGTLSMSWATAPMKPTSGHASLRAGPVLIAVGADDSVAVLRAGAFIAEGLQREATVVSAIDPLQQYGWLQGYGTYPRGAPESLVEARRSRFEREMAAVGTSARWSVKIELGSVSDVLARAARETQASVVVMGIGRHRPVDRLLGAETVLRTVRRVDCPVFAVPRAFTARPSTVVVGMDFSEAGRHAATCMLPLIAPNATVQLVHVWQPSDFADEAHVERDEQYRAALPHLFRQLIGTLAIPPTVTVKYEVREGRPAERLLDVAEAHHADLIVVGRHGQGLFERLWVGSVATRVLRGASCAVLVVPEPTLHAQGLVSESYPPSEWPRQLEAFSRRNAGRVTILEIGDVNRIDFSREQGYVLFGTSYRERENDVEIILGEANGRRRHMTSTIPNATSLVVWRDGAGADHALRIEHGTSQTLLTLVPTGHAEDAARASGSTLHERASDHDGRFRAEDGAG